MDELPVDDVLLALLDSYTAAGSDIENRVMAQVEREEELVALQAQVAALRADVTAMRAEMAELNRMLLSGQDTSLAHSATDSRGKPLLPYARPDKVLPILS